MKLTDEFFTQRRCEKPPAGHEIRKPTFNMSKDSAPAASTVTTPVHASSAANDGAHDPEIAAPTLDVDRAHLSEVSNASSYDKQAYTASPLSPFETYNLRVDRDEGDRATEFNVCSIARPHMRAFHCAWFSFFLAFMLWFCPAPLLGEIQITLGLSKQDLWTSSICSDATAIIMRLFAGPTCDNYDVQHRFPRCTGNCPHQPAGLPAGGGPTC